MEADINEIGKKLDGSVLVLPFTKLFSDAVRIRERVIEAREEMEVRMIPTETAVYSPFLPSASSSVHELQGLVPEALVRTIRTQISNHNVVQPYHR